MVVQHSDKNLNKQNKNLYKNLFKTNQESIITYFHNQLFVDYNSKESKKKPISFIFFQVERTSDVIFPIVDVDGDKESSLLFTILYKCRVNSFNGRGIS
jgi:hypothetical protein